MCLNVPSLSLHMQQKPTLSAPEHSLVLVCHQLCTLSIPGSLALPSPHTGIINPSRRLTRIPHISLMKTDLQRWNTKDTAQDNSNRLIPPAKSEWTAQITISSCHNYVPIPSWTPSFTTATPNTLLHKTSSSSQPQHNAALMLLTPHVYRSQRHQA